MKKLIAAAGIGAAAAALAGAGTANADTGSYFINEVRAAGFTNIHGNWALLQQGRNVCTDLDNGYSLDYVSSEYFYSNSVGHDEAGLFVGISMRVLCPWHIGQDFYESRAI